MFSGTRQISADPIRKIAADRPRTALSAPVRPSVSKRKGVSGRINCCRRSLVMAMFLKQKIFSSRALYCSTVPERNSSQRKLTASMVPIHFAPVFRCRCSGLLKIRSSTISSPCRAPHRTNVHSAPCQRPLTRNTIIMLMHVRAFPFRLPPSGIYTYFVRKLVREICHLFQKSRIETALYGESKLIGSVILTIRDTPTAISEYPLKSK